VTRFCPNCGTEVDETAIFCPTCGQPVDQAAEVEMPPAPAWPDPDPSLRPPAEPAAPPRGEEPPAPPAPPQPAPPATQAPQRPSDRTAAGVNLPISMPLTVSGWLIGGGAVVGALGALLSLLDGFANPVDLILLVALVGVAATVFAAAALPAIPQLRLATLAVVLIAFGVSLDRLGFGGAGAATLLLFLGTAAAAIGAILIELGRDEPIGAA